MTRVAMPLQLPLFPAAPPRDVDALVASAHAVIDDGFAAGADLMMPLLSGGHDSHCSCHVASQHHRFVGEVHHINTGIGAKKTRMHVEQICKDDGWQLKVYESNFSYEKFVRRLGFPGPGSHQWIYNKLKDRCVAQMVKRGRGFKTMLLTGCRSEESTRRMGHVEPVKVGETSKKTGITRKTNRVWVAPCHDWTADEQRLYMNAMGLRRNQLKERLGMSGECFCGAFAIPGELDAIRVHAPDVAEEIDRLAVIARELGLHSEWGTRPEKQKGLVVAETGPMCRRCDIKADAAGLLFRE